MVPALQFNADGTSSWADGYYNASGEFSGFVNGKGYGDYEGKTHPYYQSDSELGALGGYLSSIGEQNAIDREYNSSEAIAQRDWQKEMYDEQMAFNSAEALKERIWSAEEAEKSRDWQERMSNTSYQRAVSDLKAAGLNPILAAARSAGATTGSGGMATGGSAASISSISGASASSQGSRGVDLTQILTAVASLLTGSSNLIDSINPLKTMKTKSIGFAR